MSEQPKGSPPGLPLWEKIEATRLARGWTHKQIADHLGLQRSTIDRLRMRQNPVRPETVAKVARTLDIEPNLARKLAGLPPLNEQGAPERVAPTGDLLDQMEALAARVKEQLLSLIDQMPIGEQIELLRKLRDLEMPGAAELPENGRKSVDPDADIA